MLRLLLILLILLAACTTEDDTDDPTATAPPPPTATPAAEPSPTRESVTATVSPTPSDLTVPTYDVPPGTFRVSVSGVVEGEAEGDDALYAFFGSSENRRIRMTLTIPDPAADDTLVVFVSLVLRAGITPGNYTIGDTLQGDPAIMVRGIAAIGELNYRDVRVGTLVLEAINADSVSGRFTMIVTNDDGDLLSAAGAFNAIAFSDV